MKNSAPRKPWVDVLRLAALLMVITAHSVDIYNATPQADSSAAMWGSLLGSAMRACVPLFAMMTGVLLLPAVQSPAEIYRRRIPRVAIPALLWSVIYCLMPWFIGLAGGDAEVVRVFFPFEFNPSFALADALRGAALAPIDFGGYTTHMWYIYMLIGLYLALPFISSWLADRSLVRIFMTLWAVSLAVPYVDWLVGGGVLGVCEWNAFGMFYYFGGFAGYMIFGWLLANNEPRGSVVRTVVLGVVMWIAGFLFTWQGHASMSAQYSYAENPEALELFWQFLSPNVALMTIGLFIIARRMKVSSPIVCRALEGFTRCSFGSYLVHYLFIGPATMIVAPLGLPIPAGVALTVLLIFAASWLTTRIIYAIAGRAAKYIVG